MTRISTRAANTVLLNQSLRVQQRLFDAQVAVSSEKKTQVYQGIANDSRRLVNIENSRDLLGRFNENNSQMDVKLEVMNTSVEAIQETLNDFRIGLGNFETTSKKDAVDVKDIQDHAFRALKAIEGYLNIDIDGQYLFSGNKVLTEPIDFGLTTIDAFQEKFNGDSVSVATTRDAALENFSFGQDVLNSDVININASNFLQFRQDSADELTTLISTGSANAATGSVATISSATINAASGTNALVHSADGAAGTSAGSVLTTIFTNVNASETFTVIVEGETLSTFTSASTANDLINAINATDVGGRGDISATFDTDQFALEIVGEGGVSITFTSADTILADMGMQDIQGFLTSGTASNFATAGDSTDLLTAAFTNLAATDTLTFDVLGGTGSNDAVAFTVEGKTIDDLMSHISNTDADVTATFNTTSNQIDIVSANGGEIITFSDGGGGLSELAFTDGTTTVSDGSSTTFTYQTTQADSDTLVAAFGASATDVFTIELGTGDTATFTVGNQTIADLVSTITGLDTSITASYNTTNNKIDITSGTVDTTITFTDTTGTAVNSLALNDGDILVSGATATFTQDGLAKYSTIKATSALFANATAGSTIQITDTASNNGTYSVHSVSSDGKTLTLKTKMLTDESGATPTITYTDPNDPNETLTLSSTDFSSLSFTRSTDTIASITNNGLQALQVGTSFTVSGTTNNDGTYTVSSNDGTSLVIEAQKLTDEGLTTGDMFMDLYTNPDVNFDAATKTIEIRQSGSSQGIPNSFNGLTIGQSITVTNSATNPGPFTVASIASDGSSITVNETLTDETDTDGLTIASTDNSNYSYTSDTRLVFDATNETIQLTDNAAGAVPNAFSSLSAGQKIVVTNMPTAANNRSYTISSISSDGSTITVEEDITASETDSDGARLQVFAASGTIAATSYYSGDAQTNTHRVSTTQSITQDIDAIDPAFEKGIRALQIIAQGAYGSAGGLDKNLDRVDDALYLVNSALQRAVTGDPPYGDELAGNIEQVEIDIGYQRVLIQTTTEINLNLMSFYDESAADIENADIQETITRLLDDQNALEASYQAYARITQLSLTNYL